MLAAIDAAARRRPQLAASDGCADHAAIGPATRLPCGGCAARRCTTTPNCRCRPRGGPPMAPPAIDALAAAVMLASQSSMLHLSGVANDARYRRRVWPPTIAAPCAIQNFEDFGVERRGRDLWMVLAAPASMPRPREAAAVSRRDPGYRQCRARRRPALRRQILRAGGAAEPERGLTRAALNHSNDMAQHERVRSPWA